ncbi:hypothetical protein MMC25_001174 [Agyrium rufum]|nr:hypothetical protein [Agyrium rufum]
MRSPPNYYKEENAIPQIRSIDDASNDCLEWFRSQPGAKVSPKIRLANLSSQGRGCGVVATHDIEEDEELFCIPHDLVLTPANSDFRDKLEENNDEYINEKLAETEPWIMLVLAMMYEFGKGKDSRWWPYFRLLPDVNTDDMNCLLVWTKSELEELQASAIIDKVDNTKNSDEIEEICCTILERVAGFWGSIYREDDYADPFGPVRTLAHHFARLIMAYAFDLEKSEDEVEQEEEEGEDGFVEDRDEQLPKGMVPFADMLNADGDRKNARLCHETDGLKMMSTKKIHAGEEIFNDYGDLPRSDLLRRYGYISDEYKKYDVVEISFELIFNVSQELQLSKGQAGAASNEIISLLEQWDAYDDSFDLTRECGDRSQKLSGFDPMLIMTLKATTLTADEVDVMRRLQKPPKPFLEESSITLLKDVVIARQREYVTSLAEDANLLQSADLPRRKRMAIEVRMGEKEILASTLQFLNEELEKIRATDDGDTVMGIASESGPENKRRRKV